MFMVDDNVSRDITPPPILRLLSSASLPSGLRQSYLCGRGKENPVQMISHTGQILIEECKVGLRCMFDSTLDFFIIVLELCRLRGKFCDRHYSVEFWMLPCSRVVTNCKHETKLTRDKSH